MDERLTLFARDAADMQVIAACLQDALVRVGDMNFFVDQSRFGVLVNRFRWESRSAAGDGAGTPDGDQRFASTVGHERVHSGLAFDHVRAVRMRGIDRQDRGRLLNLLTIQISGNNVLIVFSGEAALELDCERIACQLRDLDEPWPTAWRPQHSSADVS